MHVIQTEGIGTKVAYRSSLPTKEVSLAGKKLKGEWSLQRTDSENGKTKWLLRKTGGNRAEAARLLDLNPKYFSRSAKNSS